MFTKFENPESAVSSKKMNLMLAWTDAHEALRVHGPQMKAANVNLVMRWVTGGIPPETDLPAAFDERLTEIAPAAAAAVMGLRSAFAELNGWHLSGTMDKPGGLYTCEFRPTQFHPAATFIYRNEDQHPHVAGYIVDTVVGPDTFLLTGLRSLVRLGETPDATQAATFDFAHLQQVRLDPPA